MKRFWIQNAFLPLLLFICLASSQNGDVYEGSESDHTCVRIRVGLVLDMGSLEGKTVGSSVTTALSDFYAVNSDYKTRVSLSIRNSHGEPLLALASGKWLTNSILLLPLFPFVHSTRTIFVSSHSCRSAAIRRSGGDRHRREVVAGDEACGGDRGES